MNHIGSRGHEDECVVVILGLGLASLEHGGPRLPAKQCPCQGFPDRNGIRRTTTRLSEIQELIILLACLNSASSTVLRCTLRPKGVSWLMRRAMWRFAGGMILRRVGLDNISTTFWGSAAHGAAKMAAITNYTPSSDLYIRLPTGTSQVRTRNHLPT